ncbi:MAG: stage 0 sporulation family protein [Peptococcaceae bacterium]|nr:stage 0 sporulation family protein [Peptococcaceae bacterium]
MAGKVVGVRFKKAGKIYFFDPGTLDLKPGDAVIVETVRGLELGRVVEGPEVDDTENREQPLKPVVRKASPEDIVKAEELKQKEREAFKICLDKIAAHGLDMKLVDVDYTFDESKIIFYFTAEGRIDFRELVRDLAGVFRTRIELRQIGVRDEAKMMGGLGCCGRELCCATWLSEFSPVSIRMAKDQGLSLNPAKISGICGRLMCCLKYENDIYDEAKKEYPEPGTKVKTPEGEGRVTAMNIFKGTVSVELADTKVVNEFPLDEVETLPAQEG